MKLPNFKLEEYFAKWEFKAPHLFCMSDTERFTMKELLDLADQECLKLWETLHLGYTDTKGDPILHKEIQKLHAKNQEILNFAGAEEGIYCTMQALLNSDDHVIVVTPCYQSLLSLPKNICKSVSEVSLDNQWNLDISKIENEIQKKTSMIIINFPHNPTGKLLSKDQFEKLIDLARKNNVIIFSDEVYRYLEINENNRLPSFSDAYENGISLGVLSKSFGLPGLRIGWITTQNPSIIKSISAYKHYTSICNSAPSEILAIIALRNKEKLLKRNRKILLDNLSLLDNTFEKYRDILSWNRPEGGCIGFPKFEGDVDLFAEKLVEKEGILILPGTIYDYSGNHFRIGFGRKNMPEILERFENFLKNEASNI